KLEGWYPGDTVNEAIGQGYLTATPMQLLRMASVIATDGKLIDPYLVKQIGSHEARGPKNRFLSLSKKTLSVIREGMQQVVNASDGTGVYAAVPGLEIAGKTGTAQVEGKNPHAWFVGFSPSFNARASLVVLVEHGGMGGLVASEMAGAIFQQMAELELL
ncbi:MAG: penicillin-binding transpeptidase domain-containing protein, partial [Candidatus Omnitrophota bacterium]